MPDIYYYLATSLVGVIVWAIRLEGRVNTSDQKHSDLKELINAKFEGLDKRLERMERILNGSTYKE